MDVRARAQETLSAAIRKSALEEWTLAAGKWTPSAKRGRARPYRAPLPPVVVRRILGAHDRASPTSALRITT